MYIEKKKTKGGGGGAGTWLEKPAGCIYPVTLLLCLSCNGSGWNPRPALENPPGDVAGRGGEIGV